jgi:stage V sporulation protein S
MASERSLAQSYALTLTALPCLFAAATGDTFPKFGRLICMLTPKESNAMPLVERIDEATQDLDTAATPAAAPTTSKILKISVRSKPSAAAGAIAGVIREGSVAEVQSIGAGATNQAIKAVAIARNYLQEEDVNIVCIPSFVSLMIDGQERTAIRLLVERHASLSPKAANGRGFQT